MPTDEVLEGSKLPIRMIQRVLVGSKKEEPKDNGQLRGNIIYTRVKHQGKTLNLIIDDGSGMNVISSDVAQKLKLPMEKHSDPYKLSWVDDTSIPFKNHCSLTFLVGKNYLDILCCDVLPMKACHLLFGRPLLYSKKESCMMVS